MATHTGKIGRLSKKLREELGRRMEDGQAGPELADWLNSLPEVQAVLQEKFGGRPINEQNLSAWRLSGHVNWLRRQEARAGVAELIGDSNQMDDSVGDWSLGERLGTVLAAELNAVGMALLGEETDLEQRWERLREIHREVSRLRQDDDRARRAALQQERWDRELEKEGVTMERVKRCMEEPEAQDPKSKVGEASVERAVNGDETRQNKVNQVSQGHAPGSGDIEGRGIIGRGIKNEAEARPAIPVNSQTEAEARPAITALPLPAGTDALEAEVARLNAGRREDENDGRQGNEAQDEGDGDGGARADWDAEDERILKEAAAAHRRREAARQEEAEQRLAEENRLWRVEAGFEEPTEEDIALGRTKRKRWNKTEQETA